MKKRILLIIGIIWLMYFIFYSGLALLTEDGEEKKQIPDSAGYVLDQTNTLSESEVSELSQVLQQFADKKGSQIFVLMVNTVVPDTIEEYATKVFEKWKIGRKGIDDGILYLVAKDDRRQRIEVGYGLEGVVTDALASRILDETAMPYFKKNEFGKGVTYVVRQLIALVNGEPLPKFKQESLTESTDESTNEDVHKYAIVAGILIAFIVLISIPPLLATVISFLVGLVVLESIFGAILTGVIMYFIFKWLWPDVGSQVFKKGSGGGGGGGSSSSSSSSSSWSGGSSWSSGSSSSSSSSSSGRGGSSGGGGSSGSW